MTISVLSIVLSQWQWRNRLFNVLERNTQESDVKRKPIMDNTATSIVLIQPMAVEEPIVQCIGEKYPGIRCEKKAHHDRYCGEHNPHRNNMAVEELIVQCIGFDLIGPCTKKARHGRY